MRLILRKLGAAILLSILPGMLGCLGSTTIHTIHNPGATGVSVGNGEYAMPNAKGELVVGKLSSKDIPPGVLFRVPKDRQELLDTLKAAGVKMGESDGKAAPEK